MAAASLRNNGGDNAPASSLGDVLDVLLRFGALLLRAGSTAIRTRECLGLAARQMQLDELSASLALDSLTISIGRAGERATAVREIGPSMIDAWRIRQLERLAETIGPDRAPDTMVADLAKIETAPHQFAALPIAAMIGIASGCFAFINGGGIPEMAIACIGGGIGQGLRSGLSHLRLNQFAVAALCAAAASGVYVSIAVAAARAGFGSAPHPVGVMSSVLFLVPGFPLIAALFDLLQHQTGAAIGRLAYGLMILLAVSLGLSVVVALSGIDLSPQPRPELVYPLTLALRAAASFVAAAAFAMLFNNSLGIAALVGVVALGANSLRLVLHDAGLMLAPAAFFAALFIGVAALLAPRTMPRIALVVPAIVIMVPGLYAFDALVSFNRGEVLDGLGAAASCSFIIGALAMGLATARFLDRRY